MSQITERDADNPALIPKNFPTHMDVELSSKCNLRCRFCHLSYFDPPALTQFTFDEFKEKIGPFIPHLSSITLFNKYEALTCRDFVPIFEYLSQFDLETYFSTNGHLLNDEIIDTIVGHLTYLTVSVTGFTRDSYIRNMGSDGLELVKNKLAQINALKSERGTRYPILRISTVGMLETLDELTMAIDFAETFAAEEGVQMTSLKALGEDLVGQMPLNNLSLYSEKCAQAVSYAKTKGVKFVLQSGAVEENQTGTTDLGHRFCDLPWYRLSVQPNGDVYPCPMAYDPVGNLAKTTLDEIWQGSNLEKFRAGVNDAENMNVDCLNCTHCRHRSLTRVEVNDYSAADTYPTGLHRKVKTTA